MQPSSIRHRDVAVVLALGALVFYAHRLVAGLAPALAGVAALGACAGWSLAAYGVLFRSSDVRPSGMSHPPAELLIGLGLALAVASGMWWA